MHKHALLIFSGGQDSGTCLAWALKNFAHVTTLGFDYGQRHQAEMACRAVLREAVAREFPQWRQRLGEDVVLRTDFFGQVEATALTAALPIHPHEAPPAPLPQPPLAAAADAPSTADAPPAPHASPAEGAHTAAPPNTFVPGRNIIFLALAAAWAYGKGLRHIIMGVCETDFSGYPDCRDDAIKAMQVALNAGMLIDGQPRYAIHTPLMWRTKAQTWELARSLGGDTLVDLLLEHTHTCYLGARDTRHIWGYGCGACPACRLRAAGYAEYLKKARRENVHA